VFDDFKQNDVKSFEEIYQAIILEFKKMEIKKYGLNGFIAPPTREEVKKMLDKSEKQGAIEKVDKEK